MGRGWDGKREDGIGWKWLRGRGGRIEWEKMEWDRMVVVGGEVRERGQDRVRGWDGKIYDGIGWKRMKGGDRMG